MTRFAILTACCLAWAFPAGALSGEPAANRYTMQPTENGFVRLDTSTGQMWVCMHKETELVCKSAADERSGSGEALSDLAARIEALEKRLDALSPSTGGVDGPDQAELDRAISAMEKMMRRFFGMIEDLQKDFDANPSVPPEPIPDRT